MFLWQQQRTLDMTAFAGCTVPNHSGSEPSTPHQTGNRDACSCGHGVLQQRWAGRSYFSSSKRDCDHSVFKPNYTNTTIAVDTTTVPASTNPVQALTTFYLSDHLGTTQMEFAGGGWPVWKGEFSPFGQETES